MAYYDPRKKMVPDYDPSGQYSDPGGFNTGVPPTQNAPAQQGAGSGQSGGGGNDWDSNPALWLYNKLFAQFGNHQGSLLWDNAYRDKLVNEVLPQQISNYGQLGRTPGWMAYKANELPAEAYWRLRQALGLPQLHI